MAQYTLELREIVKNNDIFDFDYPIWNEEYRPVLEEKIINHFYFREIGVETVGRFIKNLKTRMNEIMPLYNKMYMVQGLEQRIMDNYDVTETYSSETNNNTNSTQTENGTTKDTKLFSDTPQGRITLTDTQFVTTINDDNVVDTNTSTGVAEGTAIENWERKMKGNIGVQTDADAVMKYMQSLVNVDEEVFKALNNLFMLVY